MKTKLLENLEWYVTKFNNAMIDVRLNDLDEYIKTSQDIFYDLYYVLGLISEKEYITCSSILLHYASEIILERSIKEQGKTYRQITKYID